MPPFRRSLRMAKSIARLFKWKKRSKAKRRITTVLRGSSARASIISRRRSLGVRIPYTRSKRNLIKSRSKRYVSLAKRVALAAQPKSVRLDTGSFWLAGNPAANYQGGANYYVLQHIFKPDVLRTFFNDIPLADRKKKRVYLGQFYYKCKITIPYTQYANLAHSDPQTSNPAPHPPVEYEIYMSYPKDDLPTQEVNNISFDDPTEWTRWINDGFSVAGIDPDALNGKNRHLPMMNNVNLSQNLVTKCIRKGTLRPGKSITFSRYSKYYRSFNFDEIDETSTVAFRRLSKIYWIRFKSEQGSRQDAQGNPVVSQISFDTPYMLQEWSTQYRFQVTNAITPTVTQGLPDRNTESYGGQVAPSNIHAL